MQRIAIRVFMNYEKEEDWLNSMASKGLALTDFFFCRYTFTDCKPGEYIYRIELLDNLPSQAESWAYINFMAENGVDHVASYIRWVYFRRKAADGPFDIYSDIDSRISHYKRILALWLPIMLMDFFIGITNIDRELGRLSAGNNYGTGYIGIVAGIILLFLGALIVINWNAVRIKIKRLKQEKQLRE